MVDLLTVVAVLLIGYVFLFLGFVFWFIQRLRWNFSVIILRYLGDKRRPLLLVRRGRKVRGKGTTTLYVKGYKRPLRDFHSEWYYPAEKSSLGGLLLFEFKRGWLSPMIPTLKDVPEEQRVALQKIIDLLHSRGVVDFSYDDMVFKKLMLKVVDDVDVEWFLRTQQRIDAQYQTGWRDFLARYGGHMMLAVVAGAILVGYIVYLKEVPSLTGQCISAGVEAAKNTYLRDIAGKAAASAGIGLPPG